MEIWYKCENIPIVLCGDKVDVRLRQSQLSSPERIFSTMTLLPKKLQLWKAPALGVCRHACSCPASTAWALSRGMLRQPLSRTKMPSCEKAKLGPRGRRRFTGNCPVASVVQSLPLYYRAKQNVSLISGCWEMDGLWSEGGSSKLPSYFGPECLLWNTAVSFLNFRYKDCYSHRTKKYNPMGWESLQIMYLMRILVCRVYKEPLHLNSR